MSKPKKKKHKIKTNKIAAIIMLIATITLYISSIIYQVSSSRIG